MLLKFLIPLFGIGLIFAVPLKPELDEWNAEQSSFFQGDIRNEEFNDPRKKGAAISINGLGRQWPDRTVPYTITPGYTAEEIEVIKEGIRLIEDNTRVDGVDCIKFVERTTQPNYVEIYNGGGCSSYVGLIGGKQRLSLKKPSLLSRGTCLRPGIVAHEFIHALGFFHEQSRPDRDEHITVLLENIQQGLAYNFDKYDFDEINLLGLPYDYNSLMHYDSYAFSVSANQPTIIPKVPNAVIGQRLNLSDIDIAELRTYYGCI